MWAQLVKFRVVEGREKDVERTDRDWEQTVGRAEGSGWKRSLLFKANDSAGTWYEVVIFESEQHARASENTATHLRIVDELMSFSEGEPEFVDLTLVRESSI